MQNSKWSATKLFLGLKFVLVSGDIPICSPVLIFKCLTHSSFSIHLFKFCTVYTLAYRSLWIWSSWTKLHTGLVCLKETFLKNGHPENVSSKCFKKIMNNIHVMKETTLAFDTLTQVSCPRLSIPCFNILTN